MTANRPPQMGAPVSLSESDFARAVALVYRMTGMTFGETKRYYVERRIGRRMGATGIPSVAAYLTFASGDGAEQEALISAFTINETYFYREEHQLRALSDHILPEITGRRRPGDRVRIWSMPCSTGEEAYSIAIWLLENWPLVDAYNIEIVGSDIDGHALAQAREGRFGLRALERLPSSLQAGYFEDERGGRRKIIDDLQESVRFVQANIVAPASLAGLGRFDVVFCRNLLIYFDEVSRNAAAENLKASLAEGGYLCLGHSESMARISDDFSMLRLPDAIVYRKR